MRPEAFARCEHYVKNQTAFKPPLGYQYQWIVVDDGTPETKCTLNQTYIRGPKDWKEGINTQRLNLDAALPHIKGDYIFVVEDDDFYASDYIEIMLHYLKHSSIVGESNSKYYSLALPGWKAMHNVKHSSLCQTGVHKSKLELLERAINSGELYFDIQLWKYAAEESHEYCLFAGKNLCVGMKGLPGRSGIGIGHRQKDYYYDPKLTKLYEWLPAEDVEFYKKFIPQRKALGET